MMSVWNGCAKAAPRIIKTPFLRPEAGLLRAEMQPVFTELLKPNVKTARILTMARRSAGHDKRLRGLPVTPAAGCLSKKMEIKRVRNTKKKVTLKRK
jgi:hypothetical protein